MKLYTCNAILLLAVNIQHEVRFFNVFVISPLYLFRALNAHHQEG